MEKKNEPKKTKKSEKKPAVPIKSRLLILLVGGLTVTFIVAIATLGISTYKHLQASDYFFIKSSEIEWLNEPLSKKTYEKLLDTGIGENIFRFDISSARDQMLTAYPELRDVWIVRTFPDQLSLRIDPRVPVAQAGDSSYYLVDDEGIVLTEMRDMIEEGLPVIEGVGWRFFRSIGTKEDSRNMQNALLLLREIKKTRFIRAHTLMKIDVSDRRNVSFYIEDGLEIKIGDSNFKTRLDALDGALASINIDDDRVKYVDLRFDDVVLGTK